MRALLALVLTLGPTDVARVDEIIDAPRALFGRTRAEIERRLGAPAAIETRSLSRATRPGTRDRVEDLAYPGVTLGVAVGVPGAPLRRVALTSADVALPRALGVGAPRGHVEAVLGEPQEWTETRYLYLYADGYPDTVEFFFRDDRVHRIEWNYAVQ
jgi:hypothetical protein